MWEGCDWESERASSTTRALECFCMSSARTKRQLHSHPGWSKVYTRVDQCSNQQDASHYGRWSYRPRGPRPSALLSLSRCEGDLQGIDITQRAGESITVRKRWSVFSGVLGSTRPPWRWSTRFMTDAFEIHIKAEDSETPWSYSVIADIGLVRISNKNPG